MLDHTNKSCQCEHISHFDKEKRSPWGNPNHKYGHKFHGHFIVEIETQYGKLQVCKECKEDCHGQD